MIDREYARRLDVATLAGESHASTADFARSFSKPSARPPQVPGAAADRAREGAAAGDRPIRNRHSLEVGFQSLGSFSAAFRELVGESPGRYGRRWRDEAAPPIPVLHAHVQTPGGIEQFSRRLRPRREGHPRPGRVRDFRLSRHLCVAQPARSQVPVGADRTSVRHRGDLAGQLRQLVQHDGVLMP